MSKVQRNTAPEPAKSISEVVATLTAEGMPFEMEETTIRGIPTRVWKNAPGSLRDVLELSLGHGDLPYVVYEDERMSFRENYQRAVRLAHILRDEYGVKKGDRVAIAMRNYPEWIVSFWAAAAAGAVVVTLNAWWTGEELEYGLSDSGTRVLILDGERVERVAPALQKLDLAGVLAVRPSDKLPAGVDNFDAVMTAASGKPDTLPEVTLSPEDDATIFYTSGTTGKPKGALGTHRNICTNLISAMYARAFGMLRGGETPAFMAGTEPDKTAGLLSVPLFHATGCHSVLMTTTAMGNKLVLMYKWDPERAMQLIERERINQFGGVPSMAWQVLESPNFGKYDLSSVQTVGYGGAPAAAELVARIREAFPEASTATGFTNGYGLTETSAITSMNVGVDYLRKPDSVGMPVPVCDVRIMDLDATRELPAGDIGELWIYGPNVIKGYWNKPEATAESFPDGWLRSGDVARVDDEGFIYIVDRAKDMLIRGGENVYCVEVEDVLYDHGAVMDAAVFGVPDRVLGEEVAAAVQIKPGMKVSVEALREHVAAHLAAFKVPTYIELRDEPLPRNANGKIVKRDLKEQFRAA